MAYSLLGNKQAAAQLNRNLLNMADQLQVAMVFVSHEYWTGKGCRLMPSDILHQPRFRCNGNGIDYS
ncbi:MAG: hypothetical protein QOE58_884 [Actinomycetota bacterium]|jgi:hypothetical protein|nr:hypothetical protein [Actinomycetota bacterium]